MIFAKKTEEDGTIECTEPDFDEQKKCALYRKHPLDETDAYYSWCLYNYDRLNHIGDGCGCPGVLEKMKKKEGK